MPCPFISASARSRAILTLASFDFVNNKFDSTNRNDHVRGVFENPKTGGRGPRLLVPGEFRPHSLAVGRQIQSARRAGTRRWGRVCRGRNTFTSSTRTTRWRIAAWIWGHCWTMACGVITSGVAVGESVIVSGLQEVHAKMIVHPEERAAPPR